MQILFQQKNIIKGKRSSITKIYYVVDKCKTRIECISRGKERIYLVELVFTTTADPSSFRWCREYTRYNFAKIERTLGYEILEYYLTQIIILNYAAINFRIITHKYIIQQE